MRRRDSRMFMNAAGQTVDVDQAQHFALLRIRQPLNGLPDRVLLEAIANRRKRVDVKLIRFPRHPDGTGL